jgi:pseudouridine-5'-phosphate glycosidase
MSARIVVSDLVACALETRRPVVALESTVVTHGLPHPQGVETALELEAEILSRGAVPATIGVLDGQVRVGLTRDEIQRLAAREDGAAAKLNPSNLAAALANGWRGSTTVAATAIAARRVGIDVFATGGIGGVHRGSSETGDVSSDLVTIARTSIAIVCAGAKAVLDLGKTLEMLEMLGVPVLGLGTDELPAFYRRSSGLSLDARFDSIGDLARAIRAHFDLRLGTGVVVANPIPAEHEMPSEVYERAIADAIARAERAGVRGRALTPYLLERMSESTGNASVRANRALLLNNARVAADLAKELLTTS